MTDTSPSHRAFYWVRSEADTGVPALLSPFPEDHYLGPQAAEPARESDLTLERLADPLDADAESANCRLATIHRVVAVLLHRYTGREVATKVMRHLADIGGLHAIHSNADLRRLAVSPQSEIPLRGE